MNKTPSLIVLGEPNSVFSELLFKVFKNKFSQKINRPLLVIGSEKLLKAQMKAFKPNRIGLMIAGFEVPHVHLHVIPIDDMSHLDFANANSNISSDELASDLELLQKCLSK